MNKTMSQWVMSSSLAMTLTMGMALNASPYSNQPQLNSGTENTQASSKRISAKVEFGPQQAPQTVQETKYRK